ncbi:glycoside hydrolase family 3 protein [Altererythrobacter salegens]|uniref:Glycoside hydrolase family 3 protein n=2 Tax=Croceibacterium salegens TaxID=1737568 RepID=A0A6I4SXV0_9SPHN|nr:glycoside hydrolase family 3 protein [Croceibacterium salegens]
MTLEEKAHQAGHTAPAVPRLGIPAYNWWNEGLHGVARAGVATVFPQAIGMAATWDTDRMHESATIISDEFRAKYLETLQPDGSSGFYQGLTVWSPNINIFRDPRWGRGQETYGEDPLLTGEIAKAFISGLQGNDPKYYKTIATSKHYAVHSGPEQGRHQQDFYPTPKDLEETYLPAFRTTVRDGKVGSIMCAYNALYGVPACASQFLMEEKLRKQWGFDGYVVTDCGSAANIYREDALAYETDRVNGVALGFIAGMDVICGDYRNNLTTEPEQIIEAVQRGVLPAEILDRALVRLFTARMKLGMFDPYESLPWADITKSDFDTPEHHAKSLEMAKASMVLLKNEGDLLPLKSAPRRIAVLGPNADSFDTLVGNYYGTPSDPVTVLDGIRARFPDSEIEYIQGTGLVGAPEVDVDPAALCVDAACSRQGLTAEHFDNRNLEGTPSETTVEERPYVQWRSAGRESSIRWTGFLKAPESGTYNFRFASENGYRVYVDGKPVVEEWGVGDAPSILSGSTTLEAGKVYPIRVESWQRGQRGEQWLVWNRPGDTGERAVEAARNADLVIFVGGLSARIEGEEMRVEADGFAGGDRTKIGLPKPQEDLLQQVHAIGKPMVLVLMNGSALAVNWADENVSAIVEAWYPGGSGGHAVAQLLAGDYSPAGRLPVTFYHDLDDLPGFTDYSMENRTYKYHKGEVLYPFGYGLSYTSFAYSNPSAAVNANGTVTVTVDVANTGAMDSDEVVQLYLSRSDLPDQPIRSLAGFDRIHLAKGEKRTVTFDLDERALSTVDVQGVRAVHPGTVNFWVGGGQPVSRPGLTQAPGASESFRLTGAIRVLPK